MESENAIRVVAIADTHDNHDAIEIPDGDIFVHAGDWTMFGDKPKIKVFLDWVEKLPHPIKVIVAGNHELSMDPSTPMFADLKMKDLIDKYKSIIYLCDSSVEVKVRRRRLRIWGSPYTLAYNDWAFQYAPGERTWQNVPDGTDMVVTHSPPFGVLDTIENCGHRPGGCKDLRDRVAKIKPKVHIFGHLHDDGGRREEKDGISFINAAIGYQDEWYNDEVPEAMVIDI